MLSLRVIGKRCAGLQPVVTVFIYLARYLSVRDAMIGSGDLTVEPGSFEYDLLSMQRDPVFEGRLVWHMSRQQATLRESRILLGETEKLLALVALEIG